MKYRRGLTFPGIFGALAKAHMDRYETNLDHLLKVGIKNHKNGALNPKAQFNVSILELVEAAQSPGPRAGPAGPPVAGRDGFPQRPPRQPVDSLASKALRLRANKRRRFVRTFGGHPNWRLTSLKNRYISPASVRPRGDPLHDADELTSLSAAKVAAAQAYDMAGVTPKDIDLAEVHDCFTIAEIIASEDLGFFAPVKAPGRWTRVGRR